MRRYCVQILQLLGRLLRDAPPMSPLLPTQLLFPVLSSLEAFALAHPVLEAEDPVTVCFV